MTEAIDRRRSWLEDRSPWGSASEVAASPIIVMRVPPPAHASIRLSEAYGRARVGRQVLKVMSSQNAQGLPLWRPVPLQRIADALLDELIGETQTRITAMEAA